MGDLLGFFLGLDRSCLSPACSPALCLNKWWDLKQAYLTSNLRSFSRFLLSYPIISVKMPCQTCHHTTDNLLQSRFFLFCFVLFSTVFVVKLI